MRGLKHALIGLCLAAAALPASAESLREAVQAAITNNPTARANDANVRATAMEMLARERDFLPTVSAYAEAGAYYYNDAARLAPAQNRRVSAAAEIGLRAEYVVFDGYRRANEVYRDAARVDQAIFGALDASETLALSVVEAYIDVLRHRQLAALAYQNVAKHREFGTRVGELVDAGRLPASERFEVEQRIVAARLAAIQVDEAAANALARYEALVGHGPKGPMSATWPGNGAQTEDAFVARAVAASHRVKAADANVQAAYAAQDIVASDALPQIRLQAGVGAGRNLGGVPGTQTDAFVGARAEWEIWSGGRKPARSAAMLRTAEALAERDAAVRDVRALAMTTWNAWSANIERTVLFDRQLAATRRTADQYIDQFGAGTRTLLDVLDAERAWFNARFEDVSAESSYLFNQYQMLAVESRLADHFGVGAARVALAPGFEARARRDGAFSVFDTTIPALE